MLPALVDCLQLTSSPNVNKVPSEKRQQRGIGPPANTRPALGPPDAADSAERTLNLSASLVPSAAGLGIMQINVNRMILWKNLDAVLCLHE